MLELIDSIRKRDPAQPTFAEVLFAYNGFHAVMLHRMNQAIWNLGLRALARTCANFTRFLTGVEIHPQAQVGKNLFIDHGMGVVIGQTAIIGDNVTLYHGVTLGGIGLTGQVNGKRHPTIECGAIIGSGAQILGNITIGKHAKIGSNSVVTSDIPENATAIGSPARVLKSDGIARPYGLPCEEELKELHYNI